MIVRTKDKIFLAVLVPLALVVAMLWLWRMPTAKRLAALNAECQTLPDADMFPSEKRQLQERLTAAERELSAIKSEKPPETRVKGDPGASLSSRQDVAVRVLTNSGTRILRVEPVVDNGMVMESSRGNAVLQGTGIVGTPAARYFQVESGYGDFVNALRNFVESQAAVIPESVSLTVKGGKCQWEMTLWL